MFSKSSDRIGRFCLLVVPALLLLACLTSNRSVEARETARSTASGSITVSLKSGQKTTVGRLVEYNNYRAIVLRRDGRMVEFRRHEIDQLKKVSGFVPYTATKLQAHYQKMFGKQYEVTQTRHYVVVHPVGMRQQWADPFDELYNRFYYYFSVRDFTLRAPEFPMVVVVFNSRSEFNKVAARDGVRNPNSYAGYYSSESNWIVTYRNASPNATGDWENNETLIHEALHQFAFNHGVHQRWAPTPQWCAEGLASMFEAPGINNGRYFRKSSDKLNTQYVYLVNQAIEQEKLNGQLRTLVASDRIFDENISLAYSLSWGLAFFLAETQPTAFNDYLQRIAARDRTTPYTSADRLADFGQSFGTDFKLLESHFIRFIREQD